MHPERIARVLDLGREHGVRQILLTDMNSIFYLTGRMIYTGSGRSGYDITLTSGQTVLVERDGRTESIRCKTETISQLLDRMTETAVAP